jgi:hypothetical protein
MRASAIRWTQNVHFSITPRARTVTSGFHEAAGRRVLAGIGEVIEAAHFVRAVVGAEPRADAAVVDHHVQPLVVVHVAPTGQTTSQGAASQCMHRTGWNALRRGGVALVIAVDAQPVHFALAQHLLLADGRDVVLRLAGDDAGVAADAGIQVDAHAPGAGRPPAVQVRLGWVVAPK